MSSSNMSVGGVGGGYHHHHHQQDDAHSSRSGDTPGPNSHHSNVNSYNNNCDHNSDAGNRVIFTAPIHVFLNRSFSAKTSSDLMLLLIIGLLIIDIHSRCCFSIISAE